LKCDDEVIRPSVLGQVRAADGQMVDVTFLLDAGADRTVFSSRFLSLLQPVETSEDQIHLAGVGGSVDSIMIATVVAFIRDDGRRVTVSGSSGQFTKAENAELSVLGRDITNNFSVIYDYPNQAVALLAAPHFM
jgi:hypothetical protein